MAEPTYRVVVGTDFSELAQQAFREALALATGRGGAELHVVAVIDRHGSDFVPVTDKEEPLAQIADRVRDRLIEESTRSLADRAAPRLIVHVRVGAIADQLAALATEIRANVLVVGTHGRRGVRRLMMGSVAEKTVRLAPCPVLVVRPCDFSAMEGLPEILPPCPECVATRERTDGAQWWCDAHLQDPGPVHIFSRSHRLDQPVAPAPYGSS